MNFLKKGPEIKLSQLSDVKVPGFLQDVYYDLKDRHLLPVAAVLLVALIVVPIVLGQSGGSGEEATPEPAAGPNIAATSATSSSELVAKAQPGLRDYRRRLSDLPPKNPFKQQYTGKEASPQGSGSTSAGEVETPAKGSPSPSSSSPSEPETETRTSHSRLTYYSYAIDVRVSTSGPHNGGQSQPVTASTPKSPSTHPPRRWTTRHNLPELTMLPSRKTPAVIYMGSTKDGKKALLMVSSDVTSIFGDAVCALGSKTCELLAVEPGVPETFVYGPAGKIFKIELLKIHLVESKKLNRAPLGKPKKQKAGKGG